MKRNFEHCNELDQNQRIENFWWCSTLSLFLLRLHTRSLARSHWCNRSKIIDSWKCICHYRISKPVWCNMRPQKNILLLCVFRHLSTVSPPKVKSHAFTLFSYMIWVFTLIFWMERVLSKTCNANCKIKIKCKNHKENYSFSILFYPLIQQWLVQWKIVSFLRCFFFSICVTKCRFIISRFKNWRCDIFSRHITCGAIAANVDF